MKKRKVLVVGFFIVVFGFPVLWYLFLQSFGENKFELPVLGIWENECVEDAGIVFLSMDDTKVFPNEIKRIREKMSNVQDLRLVELSFDSCKMEKDFYLIDHAGQIRGVFDLGRLETDRFMAEVDIYLLNRSNANKQ